MPPRYILWGLVGLVLLPSCGRKNTVPRAGIYKYAPVCRAIQYDGPSGPGEDPVCYRLQEQLVESAKSGSLEGIRGALEKGAHIEAGYYSSYPPLYSASFTGQKDAVLFLLENGADPDRVLTFGTTALKVSTYYGHKDVVETLLENGADVCLTSKNDDGEIIRPLDTARREGRKEIEEILINAGARQCWWKSVFLRDHLEGNSTR
jgi:hypothetical protein